MAKSELQERAVWSHVLWVQAGNWSYSSFTVRVGGDVGRVRREAEVISSASALWSQRKYFVTDFAKCWSVCLSPWHSPLLQALWFLLLPAWAARWEFDFPAAPGTSWLHHFTLETQEAWGLSVGRRTGSFSQRSPLSLRHPSTTSSVSLLILWAEITWAWVSSE